MSIGSCGTTEVGALTPRLTQAGQAWQQSWPRSVFTLSCARPRAPISTESPSGTFADRIGFGAASPQLHSCEAECIDGYAGASRVQRSSRQLVGRAFSVGNLRISSLAFFLFFFSERSSTGDPRKRLLCRGTQRCLTKWLAGRTSKQSCKHSIATVQWDTGSTST